MEAAIAEANIITGEVEVDHLDSETPGADSAVLPTDTDILMTVVNNSEFSQSHRQHAISAIHLFEKFDKEVNDAEEVIARNLEVTSIIHNTWSMIRYILQRKILESCENNKLNAPPKKKRLQQRSHSEEMLSEDSKNSVDLIQYGRSFTSMEIPIHSIIALYACANITKLNATGDSSVDRIQKCSWLLTFAFEKLAEDENIYDIVIHYLIPFLSDELTRFIRSIQTSCLRFRVENEAWCVMRMGICYDCFGDDNNYATSCENAASLLRRKFKRGAKFHQVHATCLSNAAVAYMKSMDLDKAQELMIRSMEAYEKVKDWQGSDKEYALSILKFNISIKQNMAANAEPQGNILETEL